jgi:hypothetical protein
MSQPEIVIGSSGVRLYQALVIRKGLEACRIGMRLNKAYTPTNCLRAATCFTGVKYPRGKASLSRAIADITAVIDEANKSGLIVDAGEVTSG